MFLLLVHWNPPTGAFSLNNHGIGLKIPLCPFHNWFWNKRFSQATSYWLDELRTLCGSLSLSSTLPWLEEGTPLNCISYEGWGYALLGAIPASCLIQNESPNQVLTWVEQGWSHAKASPLPQRWIDGLKSPIPDSLDIYFLLCPSQNLSFQASHPPYSKNQGP